LTIVRARREKIRPDRLSDRRPARRIDRLPTTHKEAGMTRIAIVKVDVEVVAAGVRASRLIGSYVYNDEKEDIGSIDDLMIGEDDKVEFAILSVGGFLGLGAHLVAVRFDSLETDDSGRIILPGATHQELERLPEFKYR
jgi:hypothetical protein